MLWYFLKQSLLSLEPWHLGRGGKVCFTMTWARVFHILCRVWQSDCRPGPGTLHLVTQKRYVGCPVKEPKFRCRVQSPVRTCISQTRLCHSAHRRPFPCGARGGQLPGPCCPTACDSAQLLPAAGLVVLGQQAPPQGAVSRAAVLQEQLREN